MERRAIRIGTATIGGGGFAVIAGPCAVESREQMLAAAHGVRERGATMLRGGAFKPRTSPRSFQGLGWDGVELLVQAGRESGLPTVSEVMSEAHVERMAASVDVLQIGARNMQNFPLLRAVGRTRTPVLLKRGLAATIDELLAAAEYVLAEGNADVILCERGIRTFERATRNTLDLSAVPVLRERSPLPVIVDPSHGVGVRRWIRPLARAAKAVGADGLLLEVHPDPAQARSDAEQALDLDDFAAIAEDLERMDAPSLRMRGVRGAITVPSDDPRAILDSTKRLLAELVARNGLRRSDVVSLLFSLTPDLHAAFPAQGAREMGWTEVPMLHFCELDVPGALARVIRVLAHVNTTRSQQAIEHVYLDGARALRPDLVREIA